MTGAEACEEIRLELGVYVLGAIEAADRGVVDAHLACCADCRHELAELAGLPRLLSRVTPDDAEAASGSCRAVPYRTRRVITGKPGGDSAR